jgi:nucleoside-diphosphate-sugar epimerase
VLQTTSPRTTRLSVVVLGATGYLGRHIAEAFTARQDRVHQVSRSGPAGVAPDPRSVRMDLLTAGPAELVRFIAATGADVVVNAAGRAWQADEAQMVAGNADLVSRIAASLAALPRPPRLIQLGSVHEYGAGNPSGGTSEEHEPAPITPYGRTKLLGTQAVLRAAREQGVPGVVLRLANVIGAGAPRGSLFGMVAAHLGHAARLHSLGERPAELRLPPLRARRDLVDAHDVVDAVVAAATVPSADITGQVINIGRGEAVQMRELIDRMITLSGLDVPVTEVVPDTPLRTDVDRQQLDISRARQLLGWAPHRSLDTSLRDLLAATAP